MSMIGRPLGSSAGRTRGLSAGRIDRERAAVFVPELAVPDDWPPRLRLAFTDRVGQMTSGRLQWALRATVRALHPEAVRLRAERGRRQIRVEAWPGDRARLSLPARP